MTVNEMIRELQEIANNGHGDAKIVSTIISDFGDEEIGWLEEQNGTVYLFEKC